MGKTILFSPIGGTDPIAETNMRDGSMLHICRHYRPDRVILYLSKEMIERQKKDNRYADSIERLSVLQQRKIKLETIERPDLCDVQEFDFFYREFSVILREIKSGMAEDDRLLINVSSGTPAMKSGLLVLVTMGEFPCTAIQVTTPARAMQEHIHRDYEPEIMWELNEDNNNNENRCLVVSCPTLSMIKNKEILKKHILAYDYEAAVRMALLMPKEQTEGFIQLLLLAKARISLDEKAVNQLSENNAMRLLPVWSGKDRRMFEFALSLDVKRRRGEYADYLRAFTPLLLSLSERVLLQYGKVDIADYTRIRDGVRCWNRTTIERADFLGALNEEYNHFRASGPVYSAHLVTIINAKVQDAGVRDTMQKLRGIEENIRNKAAHTMIHISENEIKKYTGCNANQIMELIKKAFAYAKIGVKSKDWESYDCMNERIIEKIDESGNDLT